MKSENAQRGDPGRIAPTRFYSKPCFIHQIECLPGGKSTISGQGSEQIEQIGQARPEGLARDESRRRAGPPPARAALNAGFCLLRVDFRDLRVLPRTLNPAAGPFRRWHGLSSGSSVSSDCPRFRPVQRLRAWAPMSSVPEPVHAGVRRRPGNPGRSRSC